MGACRRQLCSDLPSKFWFNWYGIDLWHYFYRKSKHTNTTPQVFLIQRQSWEILSYNTQCLVYRGGQLVLKLSGLHLRGSLWLKNRDGCPWYPANLSMLPITYSSRVRVKWASNLLNIKSLGKNCNQLEGGRCSSVEGNKWTNWSFHTEE